MSIFVRIPQFFTLWVAMETMNFKNQRAIVFEDNIFLHLSGPI